MRHFFIIILIINTVFVVAQTYPSYNISLFSIVAPENTANWYTTDTKYAGCYGWHNPVDNREYAILGSTTGNHFIDITNPSAPVVCDFVAGASQTNLWREIRTYQNYAYLVSDDVGSNLQIVDMSYLPDSVHVVYESNALFSQAHTIFIEGTKLYCGGVTLAGTGLCPMALFDISNPVDPVLLRTLNQDCPGVAYVHDMFVKNDTIYASTGDGGLYVIKYHPSNTFTLITNYTNYIDVGYNHSSYLTPDSKTLVFTDEAPPGRSFKILDVSNLGNLTLIDTLKSHQGATAHNPYITSNNQLVISYYQDGVYIYDINTPSNPVLKGFFDTDNLHGLNDNYQYNVTYRGCWGAYPYLPSGVLLASDMQNGLFVLDASSAMGVQKNTSIEDFVSVFPNPASDMLNVVVSSEKTGTFELQIVDVTGRIIFNTVVFKNEIFLNYSVNTLSLACGSYTIKLKNEEMQITQKWVKSH